MAAMKPPSDSILLFRPAIPTKDPTGAGLNRIAPLTLRLCNALIRDEGFSTAELDAMVRPIGPTQLGSWARATRPRVAVFSIERFQHTVPEALFELTRALKEACGAKTIAYGPFPSFYPNLFLGKDKFDAVLCGEPEPTITAAVDALAHDNAIDHPGVATIDRPEACAQSVQDVDALPDPVRFDRDTTDYYCNYPLPIRRHAVWGSMVTSRGCARRCVFCSPFDRMAFDKAVRFRSLDRIEAEARDLIGRGVNVISLEDENPTASKDRALALADRFARLPAKYILHARIDELDDQTIEALASSGCAMVKLGVESGSSAVIQKINKGESEHWAQKARHVVDKARACGIGVTGLFILGNPGETESDLALTRKLVLEAAFDLVQLHFFTPYPGSTAGEQLGTSLPPSVLAKLHHYKADTVKMVQVSEASADVLKKWAGKILRDFVFRPRFIFSHLWRFGLYYLRNPQVAMRLASGWLHFRRQR